MSQLNRSSFKIGKTEAVILVIMAINIAVYAIMVLTTGGFSFNVDELLAWGALYPYDIDDGQYWRLITSNYVHLSFSHILFNMAALYYWGKALSPKFSPMSMAAMYTVSGFLGGLFSYFPHEDIVSAGASGAISGLLGSMLVLHIKGCEEFDRNYIIQNIVLNIIIAFVSPVDWKAHLGGFVGGAVWTAVRVDGQTVLSPAGRGSLSFPKKLNFGLYRGRIMDLSQKQIAALIANSVIMLSLFAPAYTVPVLGGASFWEIHSTAPIVIINALIIYALIWNRQFKKMKRMAVVYIPIVLLLLIEIPWKFSSYLGEFQYGDQIATYAFKVIGVGWGWFSLIAGILALINLDKLLEFVTTDNAGSGDSTVIRAKRYDEATVKPTSDDKNLSDREKLLSSTITDRAARERLLRAEMTRNPHLTRGECIDRVVDAYIRDRGA